MQPVTIWLAIIGTLMALYVLWDKRRKAVNRELEADVRRERERAADREEATRESIERIRERARQAQIEANTRAQREARNWLRANAQAQLDRQQAEYDARLDAARRAAGVPKFGGSGRYCRGYVYILQADACEFKIGFTTRDPRVRAKAFGLPLVASATAVDPKASEAAAHAALAEWRKGNYELFKVSLDQAVAAVANATGSRVDMH